MRCVCCDRLLSNYESVLKHPVTMEYLDICLTCLKDIPIDPVVPEHIEEDDFSMELEGQAWEEAEDD